VGHLAKFLPGAAAAARIAVSAVVRAEAPAVIEVGRFTASDVGKEAPQGWQELTFRKIRRHTAYAVVRDGDTVAVEATSVASASALVRHLRIDARDSAILQWRWKVGNLIAGADVHRKSDDDYPARVYVTFESDPAASPWVERAKFAALRLLYGEYPPSAAIDYIWDGAIMTDSDDTGESATAYYADIRFTAR